MRNFLITVTFSLQESLTSAQTFTLKSNDLGGQAGNGRTHLPRFDTVGQESLPFA